MSEGTQYPKIPLIERDAEIATMHALSQTVAEKGVRRVLYFEANGGLGKTRLLQDYPSLIGSIKDQPALDLLVADIIDMYDFENWRPIEIERKIVDSLRIAAIANNISEAEFEHIFYEYARRYDFYQSIRGFTHTATEKAEKNLRSALIAALNNLSHKIPIVLRFDTFELILNNRQPDFAFTFDRERIIPTSQTQLDTESYSENAGVNVVLKWFNEVVPQLHVALILMAGRPLRDHNVEQLLEPIAPEIEFCPLSEIRHPASIAQYLRASDIAVSDTDDRIAYIKNITGGLPLLLTLFARTHQNNPFPAGNTYEFEDDLIEQTFNLLVHPNITPLDRPSTFVFCLYILGCARRGIRRKDLRGIFDVLEIEPNQDEINHLEDEMLIKTVSHSTLLPATNAENRNQDSLLLLHDEIQVLIDQSKKLDDLHYRRYIIDHLCYISREQARQRTPGEQSLKPLADHMYYELTRDIAIGYRTYTVYVDLLLRQRSIQDALILAGVFWNTLFYAVDRGGETDLPFYDRLAESLRININDIRHDEDIRYVKRLIFSDDNVEAAIWAERLYRQLADNENVLPTDQDWIALSASHNHYLFAELCLYWASALAQSKADLDQAKRLLTILQRWLEGDALRQPRLMTEELSLHDHLIYLRRTFFLGEIYNIRGQLFGNQQFSRLAVFSLEKSVEAFNEYQNSTIPIYHNGVISTASNYLNDDVDSDVAQVRNNLAFRDLEMGRLDNALKRSKQVIKEFIVENPIASTYQQALFYNTNALILMRSNNFDDAKESLDKAKLAAEKSGVDRAQGLVAQAMLMHRRAQWNMHKHALTQDELDDINTEFEFAISKFRGQAIVLSELLHDRARFWRDMMVFCRSEGEFDQARDYWREAKKFLENALKELGSIDALGLRRANLLETRACLDIINGDDTSANALLDVAGGLLASDTEMPSYAQIIAGKIALQRGLVWLHQNEIQKALREFAIALTRTYVFTLNGSRSRYEVAFETLISDWAQEIAADQLHMFVRKIHTDTEDTPSRTNRLPQPRPEAEAWLDAWERSLKFFAALQLTIEN